MADRSNTQKRSTRSWFLVLFYFIFFIAAIFSAKIGGLTWLNASSFAFVRDGWPTDVDNTLYFHLSLVLANIALYGTLALGLFSGIQERLRRIVSRLFYKQHSVVCGLGWQGRAFVKHLSERNYSKKIVAIDHHDADDAHGYCREAKCRFFLGDASDTSQLVDSAVHNAKYAFVCTGSQDKNLYIAQKIKTLAKKRKLVDPLKLYIAITGDMRDHSFGGQILDEISSPTKQVLPTFYNADNLTARLFFFKHRLYEWADLWRQPRVHIVFVGFTEIAKELILQYTRIHQFGCQLTPVFTVICRQESELGYKEFLRAHPVFTEMSESFGGLNENPPETNNGIPCAQIACIVVPDDEEILSERLVIDVTNVAPVTAVITCHSNTEKNLDRAVHVRNLSNKLNRWRVPVFVHVPYHPGMSSVLAASIHDPSPAKRVIPFGSAEEHCDITLIEQTDSMAIEIHADYEMLTRSVDPGAPGLPANRSWEQLSLEYRVANYRAADHVPVKLSHMGYRWYGSVPTQVISGKLADPDLEEANNTHIALRQLENENQELKEGIRELNSIEGKLLLLADSQDTHRKSKREELLKKQAELTGKEHYTQWKKQKDTLPKLDSNFELLAVNEHLSWSIERLLTGYRYHSERDDLLLLHDKIVPWERLTSFDKTKDQRHIQVMRINFLNEGENLLNRGNRIYNKTTHDTVGRVSVKVALVGSKNLSEASQKLLLEGSSSCTFLQWLWPRIEGRWVELVSPLVSNSEAALAENIGGSLNNPSLCCEKRLCRPLWRNSIDYRLLVPVVVPWDMAFKRHEKQWKQGHEWIPTEHKYCKDPQTDNDANWKNYKKQINAEREKILTLYKSSCEFVDLTPTGWKQADWKDSPDMDCTKELLEWIEDDLDIVIAVTGTAQGSLNEKQIDPYNQELSEWVDARFRKQHGDLKVSLSDGLHMYAIDCKSSLNEKD